MSFVADQNDADTDFNLISDRSKEVYKEIEQSAIESSRHLPKLKFLIFGPGEGTPEYLTHRLAVKKMIIDQKEQIADLPEELTADTETSAIIDPSSAPKFIKKILDNPATKEITLGRGYDFLIMVMMSAGSIAEFPIFLKDLVIAPKIRLFIPEEHSGSSGFINTGPVRILKDSYDEVKTFKGAEDLLKKVCETVDNLSSQILSTESLDVFTQYYLSKSKTYNEEERREPRG